MNDSVKTHDPKQAAAQAVTLSPAAIERVNYWINKQGTGIGLHLSVERVGCSGLKYKVALAEVIAEDDHVFTVDEDLKVVVPHTSYPYIKGSHIDYRETALKSEFVYSNPNQTGECGCGESFSVDESEIGKESAKK